MSETTHAPPALPARESSATSARPALPPPAVAPQPTRPTPHGRASLAGRFFTIWRHVLGLLAGGLVAHVRALPPERRRGLRSLGNRVGAALVRPFLDGELARLPFPAQLRRRLELLGPTFIKLGQILAIREDLLPRAVTSELQNLFDRLPAVPFAEARAIIERSLGRPIADLFESVEDPPIGSASIAQVHRAWLLGGEAVVVKVMKPGVADLIRADLTLLGAVGRLLEAVIPRYQPRQVISEFAAYTIREIDYGYEADNAETFAANFADEPDVVFPRIVRDASAADVLTMEFLDGLKPSDPRVLAMPAESRARLIDLGAAAIVRMLYQDGFFHADLHAGNLLVLPGDPATGSPVRVGFIDLGMVGRFEERTRRRMLHYFNALVNGDVDGATQHLADLATSDAQGDMPGFRRAVADLSRRFVAQSRTGQFSLAQLILESVGLGARYRVYFPVEMTLMVKALVTFEGVGRLLDPHLDVASAAQVHVTRVFRRTFNPQALVQELWRSAPEMMDLVSQLPRLMGAGFRAAEETLSGKPRPNPLAGVRGAILSGACIVAAALVVVQHGPIALSIGLFVIAALLGVFR
ncbi:ABC-1 domain-containing protein [Gemmatirosa kalamazoonensis]|uniref:ABC-1 domain-containing protein n=1 Tax=Gemmatirosa kalamazoonensis TaxID=861299 RepID=W0RND3_9BACT|nr:AarF/UbiB family protein [Gemmatirosa kalamazoonensis]AHG91830.1 ABC-1 domain-containing protein [Gemmatirosa kalamazoonensis]